MADNEDDLVDYDEEEVSHQQDATVSQTWIRVIGNILIG